MPLSDRIAGWAPIFQKDENRFVLLELSFVCKSSADAKEKGRTAIEVLGPLMGIVFTGDAHMIPEKDFRFASASFDIKLACIAGPVWSRTFRNTVIQSG